MTALTIISRYARRPATEHDSFRDLGLDSIDRTCIAMDIEEAFGCELSDETVENWSDVAGVAETIGDLMREKA
ncbi:acyl carrier protein [Novosphingobium mathurense]|uniref:Acyl carrier protein n=1 Tax=Novosphingobium mathurense TaxID=428990 RepID=A0A1U6I7N8_9SPHN|nr:acyl carrier protein [Novosphingobium mathurense]SLK04025.1 acyl carrier protein [Novosphingobium mathurense]